MIHRPAQTRPAPKTSPITVDPVPASPNHEMMLMAIAIQPIALSGPEMSRSMRCFVGGTGGFVPADGSDRQLNGEAPQGSPTRRRRSYASVRLDPRAPVDTPSIVSVDA